MVRAIAQAKIDTTLSRDCMGDFRPNQVCGIYSETL